MSLLADGPCRVRGWLDSADTRASLDAVRSLGVVAEFRDGCLTLNPPRYRDRPEVADCPLIIHCHNSGTTARLLCGLLAGWLPPDGAAVVLTGDESLRGRPMGRVVDPLLEMGANIRYVGNSGVLPLRIQGVALRGGKFRLAMASAQVKSALLLAGLAASAAVTVHGAGRSRDHTERLLATMGVEVEAGPDGDAVILPGPFTASGFEVAVPGDPSSALFLQVAAALVPGSQVTVMGQSLNPGRIGALAVLRRAGVSVNGDLDPPSGAGEQVGDVTTSADQLRAFEIGAEEVPGLIDELPALAVLATQAEGETRITGAAELRVKESDRIAAMGSQLRRLGARIEDHPDGWRITGPTPLSTGRSDRALILSTEGDHRVAMALAVAALITEGQTELDDADCVAVSYPEFFDALDSLRASPKRTD
jgi:3-phosphoshikimate 1-carboxyvinyltransferase